jgi:hypothetical protein
MIVPVRTNRRAFSDWNTSAALHCATGPVKYQFGFGLLLWALMQPKECVY